VANVQINTINIRGVSDWYVYTGGCRLPKFCMEYENKKMPSTWDPICIFVCTLQISNKFVVHDCNAVFPRRTSAFLLYYENVLFHNNSRAEKFLRNARLFTLYSTVQNSTLKYIFYCTIYWLR
jgi:hypothetical protein